MVRTLLLLFVLLYLPSVSVLPTNPKSFNVDNVRVAKILVSVTVCVCVCVCVCVSE